MARRPDETVEDGRQLRLEGGNILIERVGVGVLGDPFASGLHRRLQIGLGGGPSTIARIGTAQALFQK